MRMAMWSPRAKPSWRNNLASRLERSSSSRYDRTSPTPMTTAGASGRSRARLARSNTTGGGMVTAPILADPVDRLAVGGSSWAPISPLGRNVRFSPDPGPGPEHDGGVDEAGATGTAHPRDPAG